MEIRYYQDIWTDGSGYALKGCLVDIENVDSEPDLLEALDNLVHSETADWTSEDFKAYFGNGCDIEFYAVVTDEGGNEVDRDHVWLSDWAMVYGK